MILHLKAFKKVLLCLLCLLWAVSPLKAEINFDFGLPLFGFKEVKFEQTKAADFNYSMLEKYLHDQQGDIISQLHTVNRWFSLIKLSDKPRHIKLIELSDKYFENIKDSDNKYKKLLNIFYCGIKLSLDKEPDKENLKDEAFEELLLDSEELLEKTPEYWIVKGILFHALKEREGNYFSSMKPEEDLKHALTLIPQTSHYYYIMGQAFRFINSSDSTLFLALASYEKSASLDRKNTRLQNSLLGIYMGLHEEMKSKGIAEPFWLEEAVYKKLIELSPEHPHALNNLGYLYAEYGVNLELAQKLCSKAVSLMPDNAGFRDSLGWAAFKNKDFATAENELKKATVMRKEFYDAHFHLATLYYTMERLDEAALQYEKAIDIQGDAAESLNNLAYLYAEQNKENERAVELAERANLIAPNDASYLDTLGWAHYRVRNYKTALKNLLKANEIAPGQGEILLHIGRVYLDCSNYISAMRYIKEAFKLDPNLKDPDNSLYLCLQLHSKVSALADYHNIMADRADKEKILKLLDDIAELYQEERLYDKAMDIVQISRSIKNGEHDLTRAVIPGYIVTNDKLKQKRLSKLPAPNNVKFEPVGGDSSYGALPAKTENFMALSAGPEFFKYFSELLPGLQAYLDKTITIYMKELDPVQGLIFRIDSSEVSGESMARAFDNFLSIIGYTRDASSKAPFSSYAAEDDRNDIHTKSVGNSLYVSFVQLKDRDTDELKELMGFDKDRFVDCYFNMENMKKALPYWSYPFIVNPIEPFKSEYVKYTVKDQNIKSFSTCTTGKKESDEQMRAFARLLFAEKLRYGKKGLDVTEELSAREENIYISREYNEILPWLEKVTSEKLTSINPVLLSWLKLKIQSYSCLMRRFISIPYPVECPMGGKTGINAVSGVAECELHSQIPIIPISFNEKDLCDLTCLRLNIIYSEDIKKLDVKDTKAVEELKNKLNKTVKELKMYMYPQVQWDISSEGIKYAPVKN